MRTHHLSVLLLLVIAPARGFAGGDPDGILIRFRGETKTLDASHRQQPVRLVYRSVRKIDWVTPYDPQWAESTTYLSQLCRWYRTQPGVAECEINRPLAARETHAPSADDTAKRADAPTAPACDPLHEKPEPKLFNDTLSADWWYRLPGHAAATRLFDEDVKSGLVKPVPVGVLDMGFLPTHIATAPKAKITREPKPDAPDIDEDSEKNLTKSWLHGTAVANIIKQPAPFGVAPETKLVALHTVQSLGSLIKTVDEMKSEGEEAAVYNASVSLGEDSAIMHDTYADLTARATLVVASGNDWPAPIGKNEEQLAAILVGNMYPQGYVAHDSTEGQELTVLAPADTMLYTNLGGKHRQLFGGTSGCAPQVTAQVARLLAYLPDLAMKSGTSREDRDANLSALRELLKKTAVTVSSSLQKPQKNGAGMLNSEKLLLVARRLRASQLKGDDLRRAIARLEPGKGVLDFAKEAEEAAREGERLVQAGPGCAERRHGFALLEKSFRLSPTETVRQRLIAQLRGAGYPTDAEFYENAAVGVPGFSPDDLAKSQLLANLMRDTKSPNFGVRQSAARTATFLGLDGLPVVKALLASEPEMPALWRDRYAGFPSTPEKLEAPRAATIAAIASSYSPREQNALLEKLLASKEPAFIEAALCLAVKNKLAALRPARAALLIPQLRGTAIEILKDLDDEAKLELMAALSAEGQPLAFKEATAALGPSFKSAENRKLLRDQFSRIDEEWAQLGAWNLFEGKNISPATVLGIKSPRIAEVVVAKAAEMEDHALLMELAKNPNFAGREFALTHVAKAQAPWVARVDILGNAVEPHNPPAVRKAAARGLLSLGFGRGRKDSDWDGLWAKMPGEKPKAYVEMARVLLENAEWAEKLGFAAEAMTNIASVAALTPDERARLLALAERTAKGR